MTTWPEHVRTWKDCQRCPLAQQRGSICLARGTVPCDVLFIGEAPGASEDAMGLPFVGPAGHLLDQIVERAFGSDPKTAPACAFTNLVACYPREAKAVGINEPERGEILECRPRLVEFVNLSRPKLVVTVGSLAEQYVAPICPATTPRVHIVHPAHILARMPVAQKGFAVQKCVVQVRRAYQDAVTASSKFIPWRSDDARSKTTKQQLRDIYGQALFGRRGPDDIPF